MVLCIAAKLAYKAPFCMEDFNYAIAALLGAMLVVISMDAYLFITEVASRQ
jgi:hypothetical protein